MILLKKVVETLFVVGICLFMLMGTIIVLAQGYGILGLNGSIALQAKSMLAKSAFIVATVTGLLGFLQGYINGWEMGD